MTKDTYGRCRLLKPWPEWDNSVHELPKQIEQQGIAMRYPFKFKIDPQTASGDFSSADAPDDYCYHTTLADCTCFWRQVNCVPCKHMYRLAVELGVIEIVRRKAHNPERYDKSRLALLRMSADMDSDPEQIKRRESAQKIKASAIQLDTATRSALFYGSGKTPYSTTLVSCTCRDYALRHLPCKHIYRLKMELGE